ncbi:hypothetical protein KP509_31G028700 [Ceratopteris richardii]|uniref:G3BP-like protein n=1 Tax=Ceratopteris richardii TaxID=49495 RepID=A0A8T2QYU7_CERRI|nr:hypothetical protein KP509_31G028700 [Ceratopteris richardii]KAH7288503.1 hypothetical protein KP509_31G028700 [Ceratopteris richardii]
MGSQSLMTAQTVGNTFITQYYNILHSMPQIAYRFYTDASSLIRDEDGIRQSAGTPDEIHRLITSLDHENCKPEILTVDALDSFGGSVLVLVTGAMHRVDSSRKFVQSFVLAPQDRGYYVLNDIFRCLDEGTQASALPLDNGSYRPHDDYDTPHIVNDEVSEVSGLTNPLIAGDTLASEEIQLPQHGLDDDQREIDEITTYHMNEASYQINENLTPMDVKSFNQLSLENEPQSAAVGVPTEKKSYAAILGIQRDDYVSAQKAAVSHQATSKQAQSMSSYHYSSSLQLPSAYSSAEARQEQPSPVENEVDSTSVYVRNLPSNISEWELEDEMRRFGAIKSNSVSVRSNKDGGLYAFVDFEDLVSAQAAIEASPVLVGGRKIYIEERRSTYFGGRGRGRGQARGVSSGLKARGGASGRGYGNTNQ